MADLDLADETPYLPEIQEERKEKVAVIGAGPAGLGAAYFLRDSALGKVVKVGNRAIVIGGGNVAIDVALTAMRQGAEAVSLVCLEKRDEMPAWDYEIEEALEEGVEIINSLGPARFFEKNGAFSEVEFKECTDVFDDRGAFNPQYDESKLSVIEGDTVIVAIGQAADLSFAEAEGISTTQRGGLEADPLTLETPVEGVFAGGDVFYGPRSVVEAVECGKEAAESIDRYLNGRDLKEDREKTWDYEKPEISTDVLTAKTAMRQVLVEDRKGNFEEIALGYSEEESLSESDRCLKCGVCSECYQCVKACLAGAVEHDQQPIERDITIGSLILSPGTDPFDPTPFETLYHYQSHPNIMTSLEFERILSASGPTLGHLVRQSDEKEPKKIAWLQCVGSRDNNRCGNGYCSSMCCMYAVKEAVIAKNHSDDDLDAAIIYMDMRTFGKDYEKYANRARDEHGVRFVRSRIHTIDPIPGTDDLQLSYSDENGVIHEREGEPTQKSLKFPMNWISSEQNRGSAFSSATAASISEA